MSRRRFVVIVKPPDDHPGAVRISGPYYKRETADALVAKVRAAVDEQVEDEASGYAWTLELERFGLRKALAWALRGESDTLLEQIRGDVQ